MLTSNQIRDIYKVFGKFIKLADMCETTANTLRGHQMAQLDQATDSGSETYDVFRSVLMPLELSVGRVINGLDSVPLRAKQALENYLTTMYSELNVSKQATALAKLNALKAAMIGAEETVEPSGIIWDYFRDGYGVEMPSAEDATIPDLYITSVII